MIYLAISLLLASTCFLQAADPSTPDQIEEAFLSLCKGAKSEVIAKNLKVIRSAGIEAIPVLIKQLENNEPAAQDFVGSYTVVDMKTGKQLFDWHPPMKKVALELLQMKVLGSIPKGYRNLQAFDESNVQEWFKKREGKTLGELQIEAARQSLEAARIARKEKPSQWADKTVKFYSDRLTAVQGTAPGEQD